MTFEQYFEQFRGDGEPPTHEEYIAVCRARGKHEWYKLYGGYGCRQCGIQFATPEPYNTVYVAEYMAQMNKLDAELKKT